MLALDRFFRGGGIAIRRAAVFSPESIRRLDTSCPMETLRWNCDNSFLLLILRTPMEFHGNPETGS
jgi:hypothetical protein